MPITSAMYVNDQAKFYMNRDPKNLDIVKKATQYTLAAIDCKRKGSYRESLQCYKEALSLWPDIITWKNFAKLAFTQQDFTNSVLMHFIAYVNRVRLTGNLNEVDANWLKDAGMSLAAGGFGGVIKAFSDNHPWKILDIDFVPDIPLAPLLYRFAVDPNFRQKNSQLYNDAYNAAPDGFLDDAYTAAVNLAQYMFSNVIQTKDTFMETAFYAAIDNRTIYEAIPIYEEVLF